MNTQTQEALRMAIEWMEKYHQMHIIKMGVGEQWIDLTFPINACKEALESQEQEPLSEDEIDALDRWGDLMSPQNMIDFARAIEKAHGIL